MVRMYSNQAEQADNRNRSATAVLRVNVYELNLYPPSFLNQPYLMLGYLTNNLDQIPLFNGSVADDDTVTMGSVSRGGRIDDGLV